jgi:hypothetical protein
MFCQYSNIFGLPNEGAHSYRILNIAMVDLFGTILFAIFFSYIFKINFFFMLLFLIMLGIILHRLFCVRTTIDKLLFE